MVFPHCVRLQGYLSSWSHRGKHFDCRVGSIKFLRATGHDIFDFLRVRDQDDVIFRLKAKDNLA